MEKDALKQFYEQEVIRETVRVYMHELLDKLALKAVYSDDEVTTWGFPEARKTIDKLFSTLEEQYGEKNKPNTTNQAK